MIQSMNTYFCLAGHKKIRKDTRHVNNTLLICRNSAAVERFLCSKNNSSYISIYFICYNYMQESYKREIGFLQPCT